MTWNDNNTDTADAMRRARFALDMACEIGEQASPEGMAILVNLKDALFNLQEAISLYESDT